MQRHEVVVVRLVDPMERELPEVGLIVVEDAETGEQVVADTSDPEFRRRFHLEVDAREQALQGSIRRAGARLNDISTDDDLAAALVEMVRRARQQTMSERSERAVRAAGRKSMTFAWPSARRPAGRPAARRGLRDACSAGALAGSTRWRRPAWS